MPNSRRSSMDVDGTRIFARLQVLSAGVTDSLESAPPARCRRRIDQQRNLFVSPRLSRSDRALSETPVQAVCRRTCSSLTSTGRSAELPMALSKSFSNTNVRLELELRDESVSSVCTCEQLTGTSARYACSEERDHECKPSPHRRTSASTSGEKAEQAARADCGSTGERTGCARSKGAANLFTIPLGDERETASRRGLATLTA